MLSDYSGKFSLQVNESIAKVMDFSNSVSRPDFQPLIPNNKQIKVYKYLGIVFMQNGKFARAKGALAVQ